jgi:hypothetical protein
MATRAVFSVDIDRAEWDRFQEAYNEFRKTLKPASEEAKRVASSFGGASAWVSKGWNDLARDSGVVAKNIASATRSLIEWGGLVGGLIGIGSLWGLDRLANTAGNLRRSSLGLGSTPGEQRGFAATYGRLTDPAAFMAATNEALHDVTKRVGLYGAGLGEGDLQGRDTGQVAAELIPALKKIADQTPENLLAQVLKARHLDQFVTLEDFERIKHTPAAEIAGYQQEYQRRRRELELTQQQQKAWQDLQVQLHFAGMSIETTFIRGLTPLAPQLKELSESFRVLVESLLQSPDIKGWIDDLAGGLKDFAAFVKTPEFKANIENFAHDIGILAKATYDALHWLAGWLSDEDKKAGPGGSPSLIGPNPGLFPHEWWKNQPQAPNAAPNGVPRTGPLFGPQHTSFSSGTFGGAPGAPQSFSALEASYNLPPGLLNAVYGAESNYGRDLRTSSAGAEGPFQFMPGTARQYGVGNPRDLGQASAGAARYFRKLLNEFGGDVAKAAAGYNWGEGNVERDLAQYGENWRAHLPRETQKYVDRVTREQAQQGGPYQGTFKDRSVTVTVHNNTGGNATVSASQLAAGSI